ncbi:uncharacterized protein [Callorhinus ursinus]|uniref:uncharacterized protein n=1 Tax=Callorhinus ursinus TaxID=34884 RepID=UPI003CD030E5
MPELPVGAGPGLRFPACSRTHEGGPEAGGPEAQRVRTRRQGAGEWRNQILNPRGLTPETVLLVTSLRRTEARRGQVTCPRTPTAERSARTGHLSFPRANAAGSCSSWAPPASRAGTGHFRSELGDRGVKASPHRPQRILLPQLADGRPTAVPPRSARSQAPRLSGRGWGGREWLRQRRRSSGNRSVGSRPTARSRRASCGGRAAPPGTFSGALSRKGGGGRS